MTKIYKIGNKEIKFDLPDGNYEKGIKEIFFALTNLLEALDEKKEECEHKRYGFKTSKLGMYCLDCDKLLGISEHMAKLDKIAERDAKGSVVEIPRPTYKEERQADCDCKEMSCKPGCTKKHTCHVFWCSICRPDITHPGLTKEEPKSTLRDTASELLKENGCSRCRHLDVKFFYTEADKIISLFKDTLLKEIKKAEMPGYQDEGAEHAHAGYVRALEDIINLIKNI